MKLLIDLPRIAAKELQNTRPIPQWLRPKIELLKIAYGTAAVENDFRAWCQEHKTERFKWPIIEYLKVVDSRLGREPEETKPSPEDPRILELSSYAYRQTGVLASKRSITKLLTSYTPEEVKAALDEYVEAQGNIELKGPMRAFFSEGGAEAIILARRERAKLGIKQ